jgi:hypothetical protein
MNKMAMNESVAATCCYRTTVSAGTTYYEDLHGGYVGGGLVEKAGFIDSTPALTKALSYDIGTPAKASPAAGLKLENLSKDLDGNYIVTSGSYGPGSLFMKKLTAIDGVKACDHTNPATCEWKTFSVVYETKSHFNATTAHSTAADFAAPHAAVQFAS